MPVGAAVVAVPIVVTVSVGLARRRRVESTEQTITFTIGSGREFNSIVCFG
jgi:hypothetical protein